MLLAVIDQLFLVTGSVFTKFALLEGMAVSDFLIIRMSISMLMLFPFLVKYNIHPIRDVPSHLWKPLLTRASISSVSIFLLNLSFLWLPISHLMMIFNCYPILATVFAYFINKEPILRIEVVSFVVCFVAVILFVMGKTLEGNDDKGMHQENEGAEHVSLAMYLVGICTITVTTILFAVSVPLVRKMKSIHFTIILFWMNAVILVIYGFYSIIEELFMSPVRDYGFLTILYTVLASLFIQLSLTLAIISFQFAKTGSVVFISFL
jgi:drug/metabolite transporter (DMT)-like permease